MKGLYYFSLPLSRKEKEDIIERLSKSIISLLKKFKMQKSKCKIASQKLKVFLLCYF